MGVDTENLTIYCIFLRSIRESRYLEENREIEKFPGC